MEDSDILKRFDNDKLIDVVKNYKPAMMMKFVIMLLIY